jgi:DNA-binding NarL/FixJ family response regulator
MSLLERAMISSVSRAALSLDTTPGAWLEELHERATRELARGLGLFAYTHATVDGAIALRATVTSGPPQGLWTALDAWGAANAQSIAALYRHGIEVATLSEVVAQGIATSQWPLSKACFERFGVRDLIVIVAHGDAGDGCVLTVPTEVRAVLDPLERRRLSQLALDLKLGLELRRARERPTRLDQLSRRERSVARGVGRGLSDKAIAHALGVSVNTVSTYVRRARQKLGLEAREQLALYGAPGSACTGATAASLQRLSRAEREIVAQLLRGATSAEIARRRGTSVHTVHAQIRGLFDKWRVCSRTELIAALLGAASRK